MVMVGDVDLSMFSMSNHHNNISQLVMDWPSAELVQHPNSSRSMNHGEELASSFMTPIDSYNSQHSFGIPNLSQQPTYDVTGDYHHSPKVESLNHSDEFDYFSHMDPSGQGNYSGHHTRGCHPFISELQQSSPYDSSEPLQQEHGVLEEIEGLLRNISDVPQQHPHNQDLDMDPLLFGDLLSFPRQQQQQQGGMYDGHPGLGLGTGPREQWLNAQAAALARELQDQIMCDNSSLGSSESSSLSYASSSASHSPMSGFYPDAGRGHQGMSSNWTVGRSGVVKPTIIQKQMVMKQEILSPRLPSGETYSQQPGSNFFQSRAPPAPGYGPSTPQPVALQLPNVRLPHMGPLAEQRQAIPSTTVPATGLQLVHLLLACAEAVAEHKLKDAEVILARLRNHVLPDGNPMQRLAAYFEQALTARLAKENNSHVFKGPSTIDKRIPQAEVLEAFSVFYDCIPIGKFGHLTCNQVLLDSVERDKVVHVLDLHIWHGMQWPAFLQALALRPGGPPKLRMSALGTDRADLQETGEKLHECAKNLEVPFEFCPILAPLENFTADLVEVRRGEVLIVNSFVQFHEVLNKGPNCLDVILGDLRRLNPRVMAFAENDGNHNSSSFLNRFVECLRYYSAVFDAFDASLPPDSASRMKMEKIFAAQKINNIIACEGPARVDGHETMKYWHKRMEAAHFRCGPLSNRAVSQANLLLNLYYSNGYTLNTSECGYLALGWHGMPLMGVSAWH